MKKLAQHMISILLISISLPVIACDVCKRQQPKLLKEVGHGTGPEDQLDYFIVVGTALIVLLTLIYSIKMLMRPKEENPFHIKKLILADGNHETK